MKLVASDQKPVSPTVFALCTNKIYYITTEDFWGFRDEARHRF